MQDIINFQVRQSLKKIHQSRLLDNPFYYIETDEIPGFSSDENLVSSEDTIFIFHTVKISLPDFLDKLFTHFKGQ